MAQATPLLFDAAPGYIVAKTVDIAGGTWKAALLSVGVDVILVGEATPKFGSGNLTEVSAGGGYTAGGIALTLDNSDSGGVYTMKLNVSTHGSGKITWASSASGDPTDVKTMLLYDDAATNDEALIYIDMTPDGGTTPISLLAGDISYTFSVGPGELTTLTTAVS